MTDTVKAGTRCECSLEHDHMGFGDHEPCVTWCKRDAVRMVTVENGAPFSSREYVQRELPMCEPCAQYHESRGSK